MERIRYVWAEIERGVSSMRNLHEPAGKVTGGTISDSATCTGISLRVLQILPSPHTSGLQLRCHTVK